MIVQGVPVGEWVSAHFNAGYAPNIQQAIGLELQGQIRAGVIFENWNQRSIVCHIAATRLSWEFLHAIADYAYNRCGVHKIIAPVDSDNQRAIRAVGKMGFMLEAKLRDATARGDLLLFTMTRQQCRYLGEKHGKARSACIA